MNLDYNPSSNNVRITNSGSNLIIRLPWFYRRYGIASVMTAAIAIFIYYYTQKEIQVFGIWSVIVMMAPFIWLFYFFLTKFFNYTEIQVNKERITITHGPLPYRKGSSLDTGDLSEIVVTEKTYQGRSKRDYYEVSVIKNNRPYTVATYIENYFQAKEIEEALRKYFDSLRV